MAYNFLTPSDHAALVARIRALRPDSPRQWGKMTAGQMLVHCADQLRVSRGEKPITSVRIPGFLKPLLKWLLVSRLKEFKPGTRTIKELAAESGMSAPTTFAADQAALLELLDPACYAPSGVEHPLFGHLTAQEFGEVSWKHLDHHLRQFGV
ncbi:DUF1569 domain-containing protein [Hymenobacter sp. BT664]|uniref:DUF1569 domain-containing protein n=1 Tax=Hymenobacter montanus TaxID=2771359 RepID=A0A927BCI5_9BACT|nr:DUF1569 domain-containing protein [Hymenobacter montanus]MBD2767956.1 DUF1569 domain-containing protein [Hymenobacter montanus]